MKRKCFLTLTILVFAIFLSGCSDGIGIPSTDEAKIKSVINEYFSALNVQNWSKAKSYCVYESEIYNDVVQLENTVNTYCFPYTCYIVIAIYPTIIDVYINSGILSCVYCQINDFSTAAGNNLNNTQSYIMYYHLEKIGNSWKLFEKHT
jgi:hypothetical protein